MKGWIGCWLVWATVAYAQPVETQGAVLQDFLETYAERFARTAHPGAGYRGAEVVWADSSRALLRVRYSARSEPCLDAVFGVDEEGDLVGFEVTRDQTWGNLGAFVASTLMGRGAGDVLLAPREDDDPRTAAFKERAREALEEGDMEEVTQVIVRLHWGLEGYDDRWREAEADGEPSEEALRERALDEEYVRVQDSARGHLRQHYAPQAVRVLEREERGEDRAAWVVEVDYRAWRRWRRTLRVETRIRRHDRRWVVEVEGIEQVDEVQLED